MCKESHLFRPLSSQLEGGARTEVTASIALVSKAAASAIEATGELRSTGLIADHSEALVELKGARKTEQVIKALCQNLAGDSPDRVSELFTELVNTLRHATPKEIKSAYANLKAKNNCDETTKTEYDR